jgi:methionyl aminopeptidase
VAVCGLFEDGESGFGKASSGTSSFVAYPLAPSTTFLELQSTPEKETDEVKWLYCDDKGNARTEDMPYFKWKGKLRPHKISHQEKLFRGMRKVPDAVVKAEWWETSRPLAEERARQQRVADELSQKEIEKLRKACVIGRGAIDCVVRAIRPGVTPEALDALCHDYICDKNAYPSPLNYYCFPKSCCISVNEVICHGIPDCRPLEEGDIVNIDVTAFFGGYHGDLNETVFVGSSGDKSNSATEETASEEVADGVDSSKKEAFKLLKCAYECLAEGMSIVKPDTRYRDIGEKVSTVASKYDCSVVKTYCGHGIGKHFHCFPNVPHYKGNKAAGAMKPGHAFTIEPMINLGKEWRDELWPDGWTAVTKDGSLSAQYEHTMVCTTDGVDVLTKRNKNSPRVFPFTEFEDTGDDDKDEEEEEADKENQVIAELEELVNQFNTTKL